MRRIWKILVVLIPLLIIIAAGVAALWHENLAARLRPVLEAQLSKGLGRQVRIGGITGGLARGAVLHNVRIAEGASFKQGTFARARRVEVRYRLRDILLNPSRATAAIERVDVTDVRATVTRNPRGQWNVASFFKPRPPTAPRFTGIVNVTDANVEFIDHMAPSVLRRPFKLRFANLSGVFRPAPTQGTIFRFAGGMGPTGAERIDVTASSSARKTALEIAASHLDLAQWDRRLTFGGARLLGGTADVELTGVVTTGPNKRPFEYVARAQVHDAALKLRQTPEPLRSVNGSAFVTPDGVRVLRATGNMADARFAASGLVNGYKGPRLDLRITASSVAAAAAARLVQVRLPRDFRSAPGSVNLTVRGSLTRPIIDGTVHVPRAQVNRVVATDVASTLAYRDGLVWLRGVRMTVAGGQANADVWVSRRGQRVDARFSARAQNIDLARAATAAGLRPPQPLQGIARADVSGTYGAHGLNIGGEVEATNGRFGDVRFTSARAVVEMARGNLRVASARFESNAGVAVIKGRIDADHTLDLQVRASSVDFASIARAAGVKSENIAGTGYFAGTVTGTTRDPIATGIFQATDTEFANQQFDFLNGRIIASRTAVAADRLLAYQKGARYTVDAAIAGLGGRREDIALHGEVQVGYARLADVLTLAKVSASAGGNIEATFSVGGTVGAPTANGQLRLHRPVVNGWAFDTGEAKFDMADNIVHLRDASITAGSSKLTASGRVSLEGQVQLQFAADLQLADLRPPEEAKLPINLAGRVTAGGEIAGTTKQPQVTASARADRISVGGEQFTDLKVQTSYSTETGRTEFHAGLAQDGGRFAADGWVDVTARTMEVTGGVTGGKLDRIRAAVQAIGEHFPEGSDLRRAAELASAAPAPIGGTIDLQATLGGPYSTLVGEISMRTEGASVAGTVIPNATATLGVAGRVIEIRQFEAREGASYATASGTVNLDGALSVNIDAYNLNPALLEPWLGAKETVSGSADVSVSISGTVEKPEVVGSMEVDQLAAAGLKVDHLQVPRFEVRDDSLVAERINAAMGPYVVSASAAVPVTRKPVGINRAGKWSIAVDMSNQDLALLTRLMPAVAYASGSLDGRVEFAGSVDKPALTGALTIARGVVRLRGQRTQITGLGGTVRFEGKRIVVDRITGAVGGGALQAQGEIGLVTLSPSHLMSNRYDLSVTGNGLDIDAGDIFKGKVNVALIFASPKEGEEPATLSGRIVFSSGQVGIPQRPEVRPVAEQPAFDPRLDMDIVFESNLRVRTSTISMTVSGAGHVGGRLSSPSAAATVESRRGTVDLPGASFRVTYASMEATMSPPRVPEPGMPAVAAVRAVIRLDAQAHVRGYEVYLSMSGPLTDPKVEPKITLRSVPDLDEERLWALVTGLPIGPEATAFGNRTRALLTTGLGVVALYPLQRATARALGLEEFGVEYSQLEPMRVRLGGYVVEKLYATYLRSLAGPNPAWDFTLAYPVVPTLSLGVDINERNEVTWEVLTTRRF